MTKIYDKTLLGFVIFSVIAIGTITLANAELETTFDETDCERDENSFKESISCDNERIKPFNIGVFQDLTDCPECQKVLDEIAVARENGSYEEPCRFDWKSGECHFTWKETKDGPKTSEEWHMKNICKSERPSDVATCEAYGEKLDKLNECVEGIGKLEPIQEYRTFAIPLDPHFNKKNMNIDLHNANYLFVRASLAVEECIAKDTEMNVILSAQYEGYVPRDEDFQIYHASIADDQIKTPSDILTNADFKRTLTNAQKMICESNFYPNNFKKQQGCEMTFEGKFIVKNDGFVSKENAVIKEFNIWAQAPSDYQPDIPGNFVTITGCGEMVPGEGTNEGPIKSDKCSIAIKQPKD